MRSQRITAALIMLVTLALVSAGCSGSSSGDDTSSATAAASIPTTALEVESGAHITATIQDMSINLSTHSVPEGNVTFDITNNGPSLHELVVIKTKIAPGKLPPDPEEVDRVAEEGTGEVHIGENGNIPANTSATLTLHLDAGKYQVICNLPGHYAAGMYTDLTVTPAGAASMQPSPSETPETESGAHITATIQDMSIDLSTHSVPQGNVTFDITNNGPSLHELVVIKTEIAVGKLPPDPEEAGKVAEEGTGEVHVGEDGNIPANATATLTLHLKPGKYQVICNLTGHYAAGMYTDLTVTG